MLSVVLYGAECWTPLKADLHRLDVFHHRNIRVILGLSRSQQWQEHISSKQLREEWGDAGTLSERVRIRRLEWLGHLARMSDDRVPKQLLGRFSDSFPNQLREPLVSEKS